MGGPKTRSVLRRNMGCCMDMGIWVWLGMDMNIR